MHMLFSSISSDFSSATKIALTGVMECLSGHFFDVIFVKMLRCCRLDVLISNRDTATSVVAIIHCRNADKPVPEAHLLRCLQHLFAHRAKTN